MAPNKREQQLLSIINEMDKYYEAGSTKWFDFLTENVVVYNNTSASPFKGKASYVEHFQSALIGAKRKLKVISRTIQNLSDTAIVYQTIQIDQDGIIANLKQSVVWAIVHDEWKVNHFHSSMVGKPHSATTPKKMDSINVINDKIASIASVLGVAQ